MCCLPCRGGRHKRLYRSIDLKRAISQDVSEIATVQRIEYDPNRSARIALLQHTRQGWSLGAGQRGHCCSALKGFVHTALQQHACLGRLCTKLHAGELSRLQVVHALIPSSARPYKVDGRCRVANAQRPHVRQETSTVASVSDSHAALPSIAGSSGSSSPASTSAAPAPPRPVPDVRHSYILAPQSLAPGDVVRTGLEVPIRPGNSLPLHAMPTGTSVHNIELQPGSGGRLVRAAGTSAQLVSKGGQPLASCFVSAEARVPRTVCCTELYWSAGGLLLEWDSCPLNHQQGPGANNKERYSITLP